MKKIAFLFLITQISFSCHSQKKTNAKILQNDNQIAKTYKKYITHKHDYANVKGEARDTILNRFKKELVTLLNNSTTATPYDSLSKNVKIITSNDSKLRILSWDEYSGGSWHQYNAAYQFTTKDTTYADILKLKNDSPENPLFTDVLYTNIEQLEKNKYLVEGWGTHGGGIDFYTYRLLSFANGKLIDCNKCFNGKNQFIYKKQRNTKTKPQYTKETQTLTYIQWENKDNIPKENKPTASKVQHLKYKNGVFTRL